jgi:hypothetical protein
MQKPPHKTEDGGKVWRRVNPGCNLIQYYAIYFRIAKKDRQQVDSTHRRAAINVKPQAGCDFYVLQCLDGAPPVRPTADCGSER